jgi:hypothetical protein
MNRLAHTWRFAWASSARHASRRHPDPADRRVTLLAHTPKGCFIASPRWRVDCLM